MLHAVDERLAAYGFETNTGVKFVAVVDMRGRVPGMPISSSSGASTGGAGGGGANAGPGGSSGVPRTITTTNTSISAAAAAAAGSGVGLREAELKVVFRAMQTAYVRLLQNPFYDPDEHSPLAGRGGKRITSRKFADEMRRIGEVWGPGVTSL